jgi:hypothetical protein
LALIEREATLQPTQIVDLGLRLFDEQGPIGLPEREQVDPSAG